MDTRPETKGPWRFPMLGNNIQILWRYYTRLEYLEELTKKVNTTKQQKTWI